MLASVGSLSLVTTPASASTGHRVVVDTNPGPKPRTMTPAEVRALENRIQQLRGELARNTYKLQLLRQSQRGKRPTHFTEERNLLRTIGILKLKIKELNEELASVRIVTPH
jgi:hypothetical protein